MCFYVPQLIVAENFPLSSSNLNPVDFLFLEIIAKDSNCFDKKTQRWSSEASCVALLAPISHDTRKERQCQCRHGDYAAVYNHHWL